MAERYRREIEDILRQVEETPPPPRSRPPRQSFFRLVWTYAKQSLRGSAFAITSGRVMAVGVVLLLVALFLSWGGVSGIGYLAWGGLLLFIVGYALFFVKPPSAKPVEKRWRGRPVDDSPDGSWWDRLRRRGR